MKKIKHKFWTRLCMVILSSFILTSCTNLDEDPSEVQLAPSALDSDATLEALVTGMYRTHIAWSQWTHYFLPSFGGDDLTTQSESNKIAFRHADWRIQTPDSPQLQFSYNASYNTITAANIAINAKANIQGDQAAIDRLIGEAYFLRAFCYLTLTRNYGRVPLQLESNSNATIGRASFEALYSQIEADLQQAEMLLPDVYPNIPALGARPNKGSAKAFLSRLYMHWAGFPLKDTSKYILAAAKAKEVIDGPFGFSLHPNFRELFTETHRFSHSEAIFMMVSCSEGCGSGNRKTGRIGLTAAAGGWTEAFGEIAFYEDHKAAASEDGTMQRFEDTYILEQIPRSSMPVGADFLSEPDIKNRHPMYRKIVGGDLINENVHNTTRSDLNQYYMRYAEVLLNYAEASGRAGTPTPDAWEALNEVRRRAGATTDLTSGDLAELAFIERKWELAGEFQRWHDLVRMERVADALANRSPLEDVDVTHSQTPLLDPSGKYYYFTPIPRSELNNSPQLDD